MAILDSRCTTVHNTSTLHIDTLILPAIILKIFSFHDELAEQPMAGQTSMKGDNFPNYGGKDQCIYM